MTAPYIPVLLSGGPRTFKRNGKPIFLKGKPEDWGISQCGEMLGHPHPTFGDRSSAELYIRLLQEEHVESSLERSGR
jgi:hypothetical protein